MVDPNSAWQEGLSCDRLTSEYSLWQRKKGHRFSSDDVVTAWIANQSQPHANHILDLGCGIGSVLLHLAWCQSQAHLVGVEAQQMSFDLVQRNIVENHVGHRVSVLLGDLRDPLVIAELQKTSAPFDLITGTPPYFPPASAVDAMDEQRAFARMEYRGGVEDYIATSAGLLRIGAPLVICGDADAEQRVRLAASQHGLHVMERCIVIPRANQRPLFSVWTLRSQLSFDETTPATRTLTLRDVDGERTDDAKMLRAFSGFAEKQPM
jgi:tRNA1Val (adenine37-N6)-methyltransferase